MQERTLWWFELDPEYAALAKSRIAQAARDGSTGRQLST